MHLCFRIMYLCFRIQKKEPLKKSMEYIDSVQSLGFIIGCNLGGLITKTLTFCVFYPPLKLAHTLLAK